MGNEAVSEASQPLPRLTLGLLAPQIVFTCYSFETSVLRVLSVTPKIIESRNITIVFNLRENKRVK